MQNRAFLVLDKRLSLSVTAAAIHFDDIVADCFAERAALANDNFVSDRRAEAWGAVHGNVLVSLFVSAVFLLEVHVVAAHDDGSLHFGGAHDTTQDASSNGHVTRERALLVDVLCVDCLLRDFVPQADLAEVAALALLSGVRNALLENAVLLLVCALVLLDVVVKNYVALDHCDLISRKNVLLWNGRATKSPSRKTKGYSWVAVGQPRKLF